MFKIKNLIQYLMLLTTLSCFLIGCGSKQAARTSIQVSSERLAKDFKNVEAGHLRYRGKILEVTGIVERAGTDSADHFFVLFKGDATGDIQCFFAKKYRSEAEKLQQGQNITVRGTCLSKVIHVTLDECELVSK